MTDLPPGVVRLAGKLHLRDEGGREVPFADLYDRHVREGAAAADLQHVYEYDYGMRLPLDGIAFALAVERKRSQRRERRRNPEKRAKVNRGRAQKRRGSDAERLVAKELGAAWERVPLSGALGGRHKGDVRYIGPDARTRAVVTLEVKRRAGCDRTLRTQLAQGDADALVRVPGDGQEPLVVMTLTKFKRVLAEEPYANGA